MSGPGRAPHDVAGTRGGTPVSPGLSVHLVITVTQHWAGVHTHTQEQDTQITKRHHLTAAKKCMK